MHPTKAIFKGAFGISHAYQPWNVRLLFAREVAIYRVMGRGDRRDAMPGSNSNLRPHFPGFSNRPASHTR